MQHYDDWFQSPYGDYALIREDGKPIKERRFYEFQSPYGDYALIRECLESLKKGGFESFSPLTGIMPL